MSNTNNTMQTQTSNALHNAIMEAGGKDRPPMLAPGNYNPLYEYKWTDKDVLVAEGSTETTTERIVNIAGARENVCTPVVHQSGIQCYNCKKYGHVARECQKSKPAKDTSYHKEKMLLCKQEEAGFQLNAEQADWRDDTDDEPEDQELEAHYIYMAQVAKGTE
nr:hypothetical protein [Tanacetum cinerariifolium]